MPIVIDEDYINTVIGRLTTIRDGVDRARVGTGDFADQTLALLVVNAGADTFEPGKTLKAQVALTGTTIDRRMTGYYTALDAFITGLQELKANSDHIESLNNIAAGDFLEHMPSTTGTTNTTTTGTTGI